MASRATTLPFVIHSRQQERGTLSGHWDASESSCTHLDPAVTLLRDWRRAQRVSLVLCRLQQRLERRIINAVGFRGQAPVDLQTPNEKVRKVYKRIELDRLVPAEELDRKTRAEIESEMQEQIARWDAMDEEIGYSVAREAEVAAMTAALKLQDALPSTTARSLLGIVAKLEIIMGADRDIGDPMDFPWPHIDSILRDLK
jgi:hypothetical protein